MGRHLEAVKELSGTDRHYAAIGRFIHEFSELEHFLKGAIAGTVKLPSEFYPQVMTHDFAMTCTIARNVLARNVGREAVAQLDSLIGKCRKLNDDRVRIVHGEWRIGRRFGVLRHISRNKLEASKHYFDALEIAQLADQAHEYTMEVLRLWVPPEN